MVQLNRGKLVQVIQFLIVIKSFMLKNVQNSSFRFKLGEIVDLLFKKQIST